MNEAQMAYFKAKLEAMRGRYPRQRPRNRRAPQGKTKSSPTPTIALRWKRKTCWNSACATANAAASRDQCLAGPHRGRFLRLLPWETGDPIGIPRLLARPTAELSIEAQEKHERLEKALRRLSAARSRQHGRRKRPFVCKPPVRAASGRSCRGALSADPGRRPARGRTTLAPARRAAEYPA